MSQVYTESQVNDVLTYLRKRLESEVPEVTRARLFPLVAMMAQNEIQISGARLAISLAVEDSLRHILGRVDGALADYNTPPMEEPIEPRGFHS
jgi:hypothetical protein